MSCQKQTAADIIKKKGDYVLSLKKNNPEVYTGVRDLLETIRGTEPGYCEVTRNHGRIEKREAWLCTDIAWFADREQWQGLATFGRIRSSRTIGDTTATYNAVGLTKRPSNFMNRHYFGNSKPPG
jgi:hypothetical protein